MSSSTTATTAPPVATGFSFVSDAGSDVGMSHTSGSCEEETDQDVTFSRRAARFLARFACYYPESKKFKGNHGNPRPNLDVAWSYYENVTLPRKFAGPNDDDEGEGDTTSKKKKKFFRRRFLRRAPRWQRRSHRTALYNVWTTPLAELGHFGVSTRMFLSTILVWAGILGLAGLMHGPLMRYFWQYADGHTGKAGVTDFYISNQAGWGSALRASALCDATEWVECDNCCNAENVHHYSDYRIQQVENDGDDGTLRCLVRKNVCDFDGFFQPGLFSFVGTILILALAAFFFYGKQRQAEIVFDEQVQTASDYSIKISNPPPDALDPDEWREFLDQFIDANENEEIVTESIEQQFPSDEDEIQKGPKRVLEKSRRGGVVLVTIAVDNAKLVRALIARRKKLQILSRILPRGTDLTDAAAVEEWLLQDEERRARELSCVQKLVRNVSILGGSEYDARTVWQELGRLESDIRDRAMQPYGAVAVFVTFETERSQRNALHALSTGKISVWRNELDRMRPNKILRGGKLLIRESNQNASLWDLRQAEPEERTIQLATVASTVSCSAVLLFRGNRVLRVKEAIEPSDVRWIDLETSSRQRLELHIASAVGMMLFIGLSGSIIYRLARNYPSHYAAIFITGTNSVVPIVCAEITDLEAHPTEHGKQISLYVKMTLFRWFNSAIALSVISTFIETISIEDGNESMQQSLIYKVYPVIFAELFFNPLIELMDGPENYRKHILGPRARDQAEMNACFTGGTFWLAERYTNANRVLFVALFFSSVLPESLLLASMALIAQYWAAKFSLLRLCGHTPDVGFHLSRLTRNYFIPIILGTHVLMNAFWWSGYPYDSVCESDSSSGDDNNNAAAYTYCDQNLYAARKFPLPRFQTPGAEWMTEGQATLTSLYGWTSVAVMILLGWVFLRNSLIPFMRGFYQSVYEPDGRDQEIDFSEVRHLEEVQGYIPQVKVEGFLFPALACKIDDIDEELVGWKDEAVGYEPHSLPHDVHLLTGRNDLPVFSIVKQWAP